MSARAGRKRSSRWALVTMACILAMTACTSSADVEESDATNAANAASMLNSYRDDWIEQSAVARDAFNAVIEGEPFEAIEGDLETAVMELRSIAESVENVVVPTDAEVPVELLSASIVDLADLIGAGHGALLTADSPELEQRLAAAYSAGVRPLVTATRALNIAIGVILE